VIVAIRPVVVKRKSAFTYSASRQLEHEFGTALAMFNRGRNFFAIGVERSVVA
jgi:hypothetical protein